jgi:hypothetical protein
MKLLIVAFAVIFVSGCATQQTLETNTVLEKTGRKPELNAISKINVGDSLFSQFRYWSKTGIRLLDNVNVSFTLGSARASAGDFLLRSVLDGRQVLCTERSSFFDFLANPLSPACFVDPTGNGQLESVLAKPGMVLFEKAIGSTVRYEVSELIVPRQNAFRNELLFQGSSNKTLRLSYREFVNDMARPAFFQDVSYDMTALPMTVTFRSVRIEVIGAGNDGLTYRVLSGFQ